MSNKEKELQDILFVNPNTLPLIGKMVNSGDERVATLERLTHFFPNDVVLIKNVSVEEKLK